MHAVANFLFFLFMVGLVPLAVVGAVVLFTPGETERQHAARRRAKPSAASPRSVGTPRP